MADYVIVKGKLRVTILKFSQKLIINAVASKCIYFLNLQGKLDYQTLF